jgi:hypothetical protein
MARYISRTVVIPKGEWLIATEDGFLHLDDWDARNEFDLRGQERDLNDEPAPPARQKPRADR